MDTEPPAPPAGAPRRVLVTGAASGLGLALVRRLAGRGDRVLATDLAASAQALPGGRDLLPDGVRYLHLDVRDNDSWLAARDRVVEEWGGLDLLVNNAAVASGGRAHPTPVDEWQWITDVNLLGVVRGCYVFAPVMKRQGSGHIVNVASIEGVLHPAGVPSYNAVRAAVVALSETLRHELAPYGVTTSLVTSPAQVGSPAADTVPVDRAADAVMAGIDAGHEVISTDAAVRPEEARPVREEDAFDVHAMAAWLRGHADDPRALDGVPEVGQFTGGSSNLTYLLRYPGRDLVLRRPPAGRKAAGAHDMHREFTIQQRLREAFPYVPRMVAFCGDASVIGGDFYVMERLPGAVPRRDLPPGPDLGPDGVRRLCTRVLDVLVELHSVDPARSGLSGIGKGEGYVARQVAGWTRRYREARTDDVGDYEAVMGWLEQNQPADVAKRVVHNDFRFDNLVLAPDDPTRVVGVLDWELATLGDPLMDLGGALAYWVQADDDEHMMRFRRQPTHLPGMLTRAEVVDYYAERTGFAVTPEQWRFYEVFGVFRLAVIAQQIHYRYHHGQTTDPRFAELLPAVRYLEGRCTALVDGAAR